MTTGAVSILTRVAAIGLMLVAAACNHQPRHADTTANCRVGESAQQRSALYFGAAIPNSDDQVDDAEWQQFLDDVVTPRFPDGLTWHAARGQWRGTDGRVIGEPSRVLILVHAADANTLAAIGAIRAAYKTRFAQEAVMYEHDPTCVAF